MAGHEAGGDAIRVHLGHDPMRTNMKPIRISPANKGGLHRALGVPRDKPIPVKKLEAAKNSANPHVRQMATFAVNARGFRHGK